MLNIFKCSLPDTTQINQSIYLDAQSIDSNLSINLSIYLSIALRTPVCTLRFYNFWLSSIGSSHRIAIIRRHHKFFFSFLRVFSEARRLPFPSVSWCWYGILFIYLSRWCWSRRVMLSFLVVYTKLHNNLKLKRRKRSAKRDFQKTWATVKRDHDQQEGAFFSVIANESFALNLAVFFSSFLFQKAASSAVHIFRSVSQSRNPMFGSFFGVLRASGTFDFLDRHVFIFCYFLAEYGETEGLFSSPANSSPLVDLMMP